LLKVKFGFELYFGFKVKFLDFGINFIWILDLGFNFIWSLDFGLNFILDFGLNFIWILV